jgi:hypothetical protein
MDRARRGGRRIGRLLSQTVVVWAIALGGCSSSSNDDRDAGARPAEAGASSEAAVVLLAEVTPAESGPGAADGARETQDGSACVALASVRDQCPANWAAAVADQIAFCASEAPFYDAFLSTESCRGGLHYTKYLFDAGPRYCMYAPATQQLVGYRAVDGKAGFEQTSCGYDQAGFDDQGCAGIYCATPDAAVSAGG